MRTLRPRFVVASLACVFSAIFAAAAPAYAQAGPARTAALAGTVRDTLGHPIRMVAVLVEGTELSAVTDDSGRFHIKGVPAGTNDFTLRRIGYSSVQFGTTLAPDSTLVLDIRMHPLTALDPVTVTAERLKRFESTGFGARRHIGLGSFVGPEKVDSLSYLPQPSHLLRGVRGVDVRCQRAGPCVVILRNGPSCINLFVDGAFREGQLDENVSPSEVYAIEVYERPVLVPTEFQGRLPIKANRAFSTRAGCGVIAVWTRIRAAP